MKSRFSPVLLIGILLLVASALVYVLLPYRFGLFLALFVSGIVLVTFHVLTLRTRVKVRRMMPLQVFLFLVLLDSVFITVYGLYSYTHPTSKPAGWAVLVVAGLGFLAYVSTLAIWHWKRWGAGVVPGHLNGLGCLHIIWRRLANFGRFHCSGCHRPLSLVAFRA